MVDFKFNDSDNTLVCRLQGRLGADNCDKLRRLLAEKQKEININFAPDEDAGLVFDMKEVEYIASSFVRICLVHGQNSKPGGFRIINTTPYIKKTFKIAGLDSVLDIS